MPQTTTVLQTNFTAGELDPALAGRVDLSAYTNGAARLRNVFVSVTGGVRRRGGFTAVADLPGDSRLTGVGLSPVDSRLFALAPRKLLVFDNSSLSAEIAAPWEAGHLPELNWCHYRGGLLICHPNLPPQEASPGVDGAWRVLAWQYAQRDGLSAGQNVVLQPFAKYADSRTTLQAYPPVNAADPWEFRADRSVFRANHVGTRLRFRNVEVAITQVEPHGATVRGYPQQAIADPSRTYHWEEQGFSAANGYPAAVTVFRERLVVGGVAALPNRIWFSKIDELFNFDTGDALADEAIAFNLGENRGDAIKHFTVSRHLQVFTATSEWIIDGQPLAPGSTYARRQTRMGCYTERQIPPADVDGSAVVVGRHGTTVEEYVFADADQGYQAENLAARAGHLIDQPRDIAFEPKRRLLAVVQGNGGLATATVDRNAGVVAWSRQATEGQFLSVAAVDGELYAAVLRSGSVRLERLDDESPVDAASQVSLASPSTRITGLHHLEGRAVQVIANNQLIGSFTVAAGEIVLSQAVTEASIGLAFGIEVEALPLNLGSRGRARLYRLLRIDLHLKDTHAANLDLGQGSAPITLQSLPFSGTATVRSNGWRRPDDGPVWAIVQDNPQHFELLTATLDAKVTR